MRKYFFSAVAVLFCAALNAQNINDVLRYSQENTNGTARYQAMSGAFGALGGDLSAIAINPAGSSVFNNGYVSFSAAHYNKENTSGYFNGTGFTDFGDIELNQIGAVFVFKNADSNQEWKKVTLGINYDLVNNFDNEFLASGSADQSIANYFLNYASGVPFGQIQVLPGEYIYEAYLNIARDLGYGPQQAFLGYQGRIINPVDGNDDANTDYVPTGEYDRVDQNFLQTTSGYNSKFTFNLSTQYQENLYLGASLNFHAVSYEKLTLFDESGYTGTSPIQNVRFDNLLYTEGTGFSFNIGAITKMNESLRLGISYQSPTWYQLEDEISQEIDSDLADEEINSINFGSVAVLFPEYKIQTPGKITGSAALVFGKQGLLSFDYGYQDMSKAELRPVTDASFAAENEFIASQLKAVNSYRIGGEYRVDRWSLRGGYHFEESPYVNESDMGDLTGFSLGLGYSFGATKLDLAFSQSERSQNHLLFETGLNTPARVDSKNTNLGVSLSFNL